MLFFSSGYKTSGTQRKSARFLRFFDVITNDLKVYQHTQKNYRAELMSKTISLIFACWFEKVGNL